MIKKLPLLFLVIFLQVDNCIAEEIPNLSYSKIFQYVCSEALVPISEKANVNAEKELNKVVHLYSCLYYLRGLSEGTYLMVDSLKKNGNNSLNNVCLPNSGLNDHESLYMFLEFLGKQKLTSEDTTRVSFFAALTEKFRCQK